MSPLSRRQFLKLTTLTTGTIAGQSLLAACGRTPAAGPAEAAGETLPATFTPTAEPALAATPSPGNVLGVGRGIFPGRVVWMHNPQASTWDGKTDFWWSGQFTDRNLVSDMLSFSLRRLTGQSGDRAAWDALFSHFNARRGKTGGYRPGEKIAVKANLNGTKTHGGTANDSFVSPAVASALIRQLVRAGVPPEDIALYDASRAVPDPLVDAVRTAELAGVRFADFDGGDGREICRRDPNQPVRWSVDTQGSPAYLPAVVTEADYLINVALLKAHTLAGVTLTAKNHFGTIMDDLDGQPTINPPQGANLHGYVAAYDILGPPEWSWLQAPMGSYNPLVDLIGHPHLGGKTLLFMIDALYGVEDQNAAISNRSRFQSAPFDGYWSASLLLSQDPVAIDSVGADILANEPAAVTHPDVLLKDSTYQNYLHEAALAGNPPSKTDYSLTSLGVHDHWNNAAGKQYGRNLGLAEGIELVMG